MPAEMLTCREFADFILAWMEDDLRRSERTAFEAHIEDCPSCLHYLKTYEETVKLGRLCADDDAPPPEGAPEELVEAILAARRGGRRRDAE